MSIPKAVVKFVNEHGSRQIFSIIIVRRPIHSAIVGLYNLITLGKFDSVRHKIGLDTLFHLFMYVEFQANRVDDDGDDNVNSIILQKTETVKIITKPAEIQHIFQTQHLQYVIVPLAQHGITLSQLIMNASQNNPNFWKYDVATNNCQDFVLDILYGNQLATPELVAFVKQDAETLFRQLPRSVSQFSNAILHALAWVESG